MTNNYIIRVLNHFLAKSADKELGSASGMCVHIVIFCARKITGFIQVFYLKN